MEIKTAQQKKNGNIYLQLEVNQDEYNDIVNYADNKSVPLGGQVMPNEVVGGGRCETCEHFTLNKYDDGFESEMGNCKCQVKFPDSLFARSPGTRKTMNKKDGRNCPCYDSRREA